MLESRMRKELELLYSRMCSGIGHPIRLSILYSLAQQPRYVTELAADLDIPQPTISRHLKILSDHSLVTATREGPNVYYSLADRRVLDALDIMRTILRDRLAEEARLAQFSALDDLTDDDNSV